MWRGWRKGPSRPPRHSPGVHVYIAKDGSGGVVAPLAVNGDGVYVEQPGQAKRLALPQAIALGEAFAVAWGAFREDAPSAAFVARSAWPAFEVSGAKSIKTFEADYLCIACFACNVSTAVVRASVPHATEDGIELSIAFNPQSPAAYVGVQLLRLSAVARGDAAAS